MSTITEYPNEDALNQGIRIYRNAMRPFITRHLRPIPGSKLQSTIERSLNDNQISRFQSVLRRNDGNIETAIDMSDFPHLVQRNWNEAFRSYFDDDRSIQNELFLIRAARNGIAHPEEGQDIDPWDAIKALSLISSVLEKINAIEEKNAIDEIRNSIIPTSTDDASQAQTPSVATAEPAATQSSTSATTVEGKPKPKSGRRLSSNLKPWHQVIEPHSDVAEGSFSESEFAADLQQVYSGEASALEYGDPEEFFNRTYITPGIRSLLVNAIKRTNDKGGDPVIQTKTGFGGGKTHSLIALYHLINTPEELSGNPEILKLYKDADVKPDEAAEAKVAVISGTHYSPTDSDTTSQGDPLNNLWGLIAFQLGGQEAYDLVGEAARTNRPPGAAQLGTLFKHTGPSVILIDELVAYVRTASEEAQAHIQTFLQALTESATRAGNVVIVVTLPESQEEAGGPHGMATLNQLERLFGRTEAIWQPLEANEAFEVVRRRLFANNIDEEERDRTCESFTKMYGNSPRNFPTGVRETRYSQRIKDCYPIHPEIFDRLYNHWSTIHSFQRTRGVLRIMANVINRMYRDRDLSPLIMPSSIRLDDSDIGSEFTKHLRGRWEPVISEIDGTDSKTDSIDKQQKNFSDVGGASRRVARTIFLSSPLTGAVRGITHREIMLGCVEPEQGISAYRTALERMQQSLYFLYRADDRYFLHTEENLNRVAADREDAISISQIDEYIIEQLHDASKEGLARRRHDIVVCPQDSGDVEESDLVRLVILPPDKYIPSRSREESLANYEALDLLENRGDTKRIKRNTLLFLASKIDDMRVLRNQVRRYLAWESIVSGERKLDLSNEREREAKRNVRLAAEPIGSFVAKAYKWVLAPVQNDPQNANYRIKSPIQTESSKTGNIVDAAFDACVRTEELSDYMAPSVLQTILENHVWNNPNYGYHINVETLWDIMVSNIYMYRLRNKSVLVACIEEGVQKGYFGHAHSYEDDKYQKLRFKQQIDTYVGENAAGILVHPEMATLQKEEETKQQQEIEGTYSSTTSNDTTPSHIVVEDEDEQPPLITDITVTKTILNDLSVDLNLYRDELYRNLKNNGADVTIEITITARKPDGFTENAARSIRDNSKQLGFEFSQVDARN